MDAEQLIQLAQQTNEHAADLAMTTQKQAIIFNQQVEKNRMTCSLMDQARKLLTHVPATGMEVSEARIAAARYLAGVFNQASLEGTAKPHTARPVHPECVPPCNS